MNNTKIDKIIKYMRTHTGITQMDAYELCRATRLSAIMFELKQKGYEIVTIYHSTKECPRGYAEYRFTPEFKKQLKEQGGKH